MAVVIIFESFDSLSKSASKLPVVFQKIFENCRWNVLKIKRSRNFRNHLLSILFLVLFILVSDCYWPFVMWKCSESLDIVLFGDNISHLYLFLSLRLS